MAPAGDAFFENCPRGSFSNATGSVNCTLCPNGSYAADVGSVACTLCTSGFVANDSGLESCSPCLRGSYMPFSGGTTCFQCGLNRITEEPGATSESQCSCAEGYFWCDSELANASCNACLKGLECSGEGPPWQQAGYWTDPMRDLSCDFAVLRCRDIHQCPNGHLGMCADGREGKACNNCKEGHFPLEDGSCKKCQEADLLPATILVIIVPLGILLFGFVNFDPNQQSFLTECPTL